MCAHTISCEKALRAVRFVLLFAESKRASLKDLAEVENGVNQFQNDVSCDLNFGAG